MMNRLKLYGLLASMLLSGGCATTIPSRDYSHYRAAMPKSILVLPPVNESTEVHAPYTWLSTVSRPLAEQGYYVFPVAVVDAMMKENGLPTPYEMHQVSLKKIDEIIGADAVLYVTIEAWGQKYQVVRSVTTVKFRARLVDVKSGAILWKGDQHVMQDSGVSMNPVVMLVSAALTQVINSVSDSTYPLSKVANSRMIMRDQNGFLRGHYHPEEPLDVRGR